MAKGNASSNTSTIGSTGTSLTATSVGADRDASVFRFMGKAAFCRAATKDSIRRVGCSFTTRSAGTAMGILIGKGRATRLDKGTILADKEGLVRMGIATRSNIAVGGCHFAVDHRKSGGTLLRDLRMGKRRIILRKKICRCDLPVTAKAAATRITTATRDAETAISVIGKGRIASTTRAIRKSIAITPKVGRVAVHIAPRADTRPICCGLGLGIPGTTGTHLRTLDLKKGVSLGRGFSTSALGCATSTARSTIAVGTATRRTSTAMRIV